MVPPHMPILMMSLKDYDNWVIVDDVEQAYNDVLGREVAFKGERSFALFGSI